jgi:hypothetical protein
MDIHDPVTAACNDVEDRLGSEIQEARGVIEDMAGQFAYETKLRGRAALTSGGLSALESAFSYLGWDDPHAVPHRECQIKGCHDFIHGGTPTKSGYKMLCSKHLQMAFKGEL